MKKNPVAGREEKKIERGPRCEKRCFNFGGMFMGIILIGLGFFYLARNMGWLPQDAVINLAQLWPVLLIFIGLSMFSVRNWIAGILGFIFTFLVLIVVAFTMFGGILSVEKATESPIVIPVDESTEYVDLQIRHIFGRIFLGSGTVDNISGTLRSSIANLNVWNEPKDGSQSIFVDSEWGENWRSSAWRERKINDLSLNIDPNVLTHFYIEGGASEMSLDLRGIRTDLIGINSGAANMDLFLGNREALQVVKINAGASKINISAPTGTGVHIELKTGIVSKDLDGLRKISDNVYESEDYESAEKKIDIDLNLGASDLEFSFR